MKKSIKKLVLALLTTGMLVSVGGVAFAGGPGHGGRGFGGPEMFKKLDGMSEQERLEFLEDKLDRRIEKMTERLELTKTQQLKVRQIFADAQTQLLEIYEKNTKVDDKSTARGAAKSVMKQAKQDVGDILTDDQKAKIKENHKNRGQERRGKMLERLDSKLDLSDAQRAKVGKILDETHAEMRELRENTKDRAEARPKGKAIKKASADKIEAVLTEEQKVKFASMRKKMEERHGKKGRHGKRGPRGGF